MDLEIRMSEEEKIRRGKIDIVVITSFSPFITSVLSFLPGRAGGGSSNARGGQDADQPLGAPLQGDKVSYSKSSFINR